VSAALAGETGVPRGLALPEELRHDRLAGPLG
jgi:hypothetical protein